MRSKNLQIKPGKDLFVVVLIENTLFIYTSKINSYIVAFAKVLEVPMWNLQRAIPLLHCDVSLQLFRQKQQVMLRKINHRWRANRFEEPIVTIAFQLCKLNALPNEFR